MQKLCASSIRRLHITLLELLIAFSIIAMVTGVVGINVSKAVKDQRFKEEVSRVVDLLRLAQDLMLFTKEGVVVKYEVQSDGEIKQILKTEHPLPSSWQRVIQRLEKSLTTIQYIQINQDSNNGKIEIQFPSEETGMTKGVLRLSTSKSENDSGTLTEYINLPGYPRLIHAVSQFPEENQKEEIFLKDLSRATYEEIKGLIHFQECNP